MLVRVEVEELNWLLSLIPDDMALGVRGEHTREQLMFKIARALEDDDGVLGAEGLPYPESWEHPKLVLDSFGSYGVGEQHAKKAMEAGVTPFKYQQLYHQHMVSKTGLEGIAPQKAAALKHAYGGGEGLLHLAGELGNATDSMQKFLEAVGATKKVLHDSVVEMSYQYDVGYDEGAGKKKKYTTSEKQAFKHGNKFPSLASLKNLPKKGGY